MPSSLRHVGECVIWIESKKKRISCVIKDSVAQLIVMLETNKPWADVPQQQATIAVPQQ